MTRHNPINPRQEQHNKERLVARPPWQTTHWVDCDCCFALITPVPTLFFTRWYLALIAQDTIVHRSKHRTQAAAKATAYTKAAALAQPNEWNHEAARDAYHNPLTKTLINAEDMPEELKP